MIALIVVLALLASCLGGLAVVPGVLALAPARAIPRARAADLLRGGLVIGVLERLAITGGLLAGRPEVIGVVLAIKGLGRYPELRNAASAAGHEPEGPGAASSSSSAQRPARGGDPAADVDPARPDPAMGAAVSERFIIGTLASYVWAGVCGLAALAAMARWG